MVVKKHIRCTIRKWDYFMPHQHAYVTHPVLICKITTINSLVEKYKLELIQSTNMFDLTKAHRSALEELCLHNILSFFCLRGKNILFAYP